MFNTTKRSKRYERTFLPLDLLSRHGERDCIVDPIEGQYSLDYFSVQLDDIHETAVRAEREVAPRARRPYYAVVPEENDFRNRPRHSARRRQLLEWDRPGDPL